MELQYAVFLVFAPLSAAAALGTLLYARRYRASASAETSALAWLVLSLVGWLVLNTLELLAPSESATFFWARLTYLFIASTPLAWFAFALQYAGRKLWLVPARFAWFGVIPAITFVLALTNPWHNWIWQRYEFVPVGGLLTMRVVAYGWWFWLYAAWGHSLVLMGAFLIGSHYLRTFRLYRRQSTWVVVGVLIPIVTNIIYIFHLVPGLRKDFTSVSFAFASAAFGVGLLRYHLFDLKPIARDIVIDNMSDAMLTLDAKGRIVDLNLAAQRLISALNGRTGDRSPIGQSVIHVLEPWRTLLEHLGTSGEMQADVAVQVEGVQRCYDMQAAPLTDQTGRLAGRLIVLRDITVRKEAEKQLQQYALELEAQNEELDAFARTVAHDLKDPLSFLITGSEYLSENLARVAEQELGDFLAAILYTSYTMANIVDELLLLARVRSSTDIRLQRLDMGKLVGNVTSRLGQLIVETQARIAVADHWPTAVGYAPWVEEVWSNYLSNALKYGGHPDMGLPPQVELGYGWDSGESEGEPPGDLSDSYVRFWVRDNGPGLSEQEQAQLFVEFSRLHKTHAEGSGLGLVIVRRIVERLGGEAGVESKAGQGSTFWFTLAREREKE